MTQDSRSSPHPARALATSGKVDRPFRVGAFDVFPGRGLLVLADRTFRVEPLVMAVLQVLAERPCEIVERDRLIERVWNGRDGGSDESLTRVISMLRSIFSNDPRSCDYIETNWKRGYTLLAEVGWAAADRGSAMPERLPGLPVAAMPEVPDYSVAVMPFANASADPDNSFLADGITRDLTMLLSRVPRLKVAAYSSALLAREGSEPLGAIAKRLGVRYMVSGSIARAGPALHLRAALMDAQEDTQLWAKRLDAPLDDFFAVQDTLVLDISTSLASALQISHAAAAHARRPFQVGAYELVQQAEVLRLRYNRDTAFKIVVLLDRALEIDPEDANVHAALAVQHTQNVVSSFVPDAAQTFDLARAHVDRALELAPRSPDTLAAAGIAATMMGDAPLAVRQLEKAAALDPNNAHTLAVLGWQHCWLNGTREGIEMIRTAEARAPHHPRFALWAHYRGHCEVRLGELEAAVRAYRDGEDRNPGYSLNLATLISALSLLGRTGEAAEALRDLYAANSEYRTEDLDRLARRMRFWFGDSPTRAQFIAAFEKISSGSAHIIDGAG